MKRDRLSFIAGFMPALTMALLMGFEYLIGSNAVKTEYLWVAAAETVPFLLPFLIIFFFKKVSKREVPSGMAGFTRRAVPFVIFASVGTALLSFLLNCAASLFFERTLYRPIQYIDSMESTVAAILIIVVLPSLFEELFFREGLLFAVEGYGASSAIFLSALAFALAHGDVENLLGPFVAGLVYGYMVYTLGSIWPAIIAHMANNAFFMIMNYTTRAYETLGIWPYFILLCTVVFAFFLFLAMRSLGKLIEKGKIRRFRRAGLKGFVEGLLFSPGIWLMALMFLIKVIYL